MVRLSHIIELTHKDLKTELLIILNEKLAVAYVRSALLTVYEWILC